MSTPSTKSRKRTLLLLGFIALWLVAALGAVYLVKPEFWKDAHTYYLEAQRWSRQGDLDKALQAAQKAIKREANNPGYLRYLGSLYAKGGKQAQAVETYTRALALKPGDAEATLGLAGALLAQGKTKEALKKLQALSGDDLPAPLLERRAALLAEYGRHRQALADYARLLKQSPDNVRYLHDAAASAMAVQDWAQARRLLNRLLQVAKDDPTLAWGREQLIVALRAEGKTANAYALLSDHPTPDNAALRAQLAMELHHFALAEPLLRDLHNTKPGDASITNQLAIALRATGKHQEAYDLLNTIPNADNLQARAELALELERFAEAATLYGALAKAHPDDVAIRERLAYATDRAAQQTGGTAAAMADTTHGAPLSPGELEAAKQYAELVRSGRASDETRIRYAWLLMRAKRYADVVAVLRGVTIGPDRFDLLELQARATFLAGDYAAVIPLLRALVERKPDKALLWRYLADAHDALGQAGDARDALGHYLALRPDDVAARIKMAGLLARSGDKPGAIARYRQLLRDDPANSTIRRELADLYESQKRFAEAVDVLREGKSPSALTDPERIAHIARLYQWRKRPAEAMRWYRRLFALPRLPAALRTSAGLGLAEALLDTGRAGEAVAQLQAMRAYASRSPRLLRLAARAAMQAHRPKLAVAALERLAARHPLSTTEMQWLAGQYRLLGNKPKALALYERALAQQGTLPPDSLEALGDLRFDAGRSAAALRAYQGVARTRPSASLSLKLARAAAKTGNKALAMQAYDRALAASPDNPDLLLEVARFAVNSGHYDRALALYDRVVAKRGPNGLALELAQANLAAQHFAAAERWARMALAADPRNFKAILALVQALHLQGKVAEADALLRRNKALVMAHPEGREWLGYVAVARNRQLQAFTIFSGLLRDHPKDPGKMWLWRGIAATRLGDFVQARRSFAMARKYATPTVNEQGVAHAY